MKIGDREFIATSVELDALRRDGWRAISLSWFEGSLDGGGLAVLVEREAGG